MKTKLLFIAFFLFISSISLFPQPADVKQLPEMLGSTGEVTEYWFTIPPCVQDQASHNDVIRIFVTSSESILCNVEIEGKGYLSSKQTIANDVIMFSISPVQGQPYSKSWNAPELKEQIYPGCGIHVYAEKPIIVYCVVRYYNASDGWMCIPTHSAGKEYIVSGYKVDPMFNSKWGMKLTSDCGIVSPYNDNKIIFIMGGNDSSMTAGGLKPGDTTKLTMQSGDVWMVSTKGDNSDLSGSKILSSKPVQVVTGQSCANIPVGNQFCDYCAEMDLPIYTWGTSYYVPQVYGRKHPSLVRIYAKEPDTKIYRDNVLIGTLSKSGGKEGEAFLETRLANFNDKPKSALFTSDKHISVTLLNTGSQEDNDTSIHSDPFWMSIFPTELFRKSITFFTPGLKGVYGFPDNYIALIYESDSLGNLPDDLEFASYSSGIGSWYKLSALYPGKGEPFVPYNGKQYSHKLIKLTGDGTYNIRANNPISAYAYGFSENDSYGYPVTYGFISILAKPDTIPPVPIFTQHCNGNVYDGSVTDFPDDSTIRSNLTQIYLDPDLSYNYNFDYDSIIPGVTRTTKWRLKVIDQNYDAKAVITFSDRRGNDTTITINYKSKTTISDESYDFGTLSLNTFPASHQFTFKNGDNSIPVWLVSIKLQQGSDFVINYSLPLPLNLQAGQYFNFNVIFNPAMGGFFVDTVNIVVDDTCQLIKKIILSANVSEPIINVTDVNYDTSTSMHASSDMDFFITNEGESELFITGYSGPANKVFTTNLPAINASEPLLIFPYGAKKFTVTFTPEMIGTFSDSIVFTSNANKRKCICYINGVCITDVNNSTDIESYLNISSNPLNNSLKYSFKLKEPGNVDIRIIDLKGNMIRNSESFYYSGGLCENSLNIIGFNSGMYFLEIKAKDLILTKKFTITK